MVEAKESMAVFGENELRDMTWLTKSDEKLRLQEFLRPTEAGNLADHSHRKSDKGEMRALANLVRSSVCIAHIGKP